MGEMKDKGRSKIECANCEIEYHIEEIVSFNHDNEALCMYCAKRDLFKEHVEATSPENDKDYIMNKAEKFYETHRPRERRVLIINGSPYTTLEYVQLFELWLEDEAEKEPNSSPTTKQLKETLSALEKSKETIKDWHSMDTPIADIEEMWRYYQESPEMKAINEAITNGKEALIKVVQSATT